MKKAINILVPIDFSVCSENALAFAMQLADKIKASLLILNVQSVDYNNMENPVSASLVVEEQIEKSSKRIKKSIQKASESFPSFLSDAPSIRTSVEMGKVEPTICEIATRNQVDYIVMGTQGENSILDKYLGSVASNVLKNAPCSIFVIPETTAFSNKVKIGYATNFSDADPFGIWRVTKLFKPFQPKITCVHFNETQDYNEDKVQELEAYFAETAPELNIKIHNLPVKNKVKDINNFIEEHHINMLVMYKPKRTFFESIFKKSYTQKMARHISIPLLVLKESS